MTASAQRQLDQLDEETKALLDELESCSHPALNTAPEPGAWSAVQTMHHLLLSEALSLAYLRKKLSFDPELQPAGWAEKSREWFLRLFYKTGFKRKAPLMISGDKLPTEATLAATRAEWLAMRKDFREYLSGLAPELFAKSVFKHPIVGRMSLEGMLYFHWVHFRHHRKQVRAAVRQAISEE